MEMSTPPLVTQEWGFGQYSLYAKTSLTTPRRGRPGTPRDPRDPDANRELLCTIIRLRLSPKGQRIIDEALAAYREHR